MHGHGKPNRVTEWVHRNFRHGWMGMFNPWEWVNAPLRARERAGMQREIDEMEHRINSDPAKRRMKFVFERGFSRPELEFFFGFDTNFGDARGRELHHLSVECALKWDRKLADNANVNDALIRLGCKNPLNLQETGILKELTETRQAFVSEWQRLMRMETGEEFDEAAAAFEAKFSNFAPRLRKAKGIFERAEAEIKFYGKLPVKK